MIDRVLWYINITVSFHTTFLKKPDKYYWVKLKHMLKYLNGKSNLKLVLIVGNISVVKWWADASYVVHEYFLGRTGAMISLGKVTFSSYSKKL